MNKTIGLNTLKQWAFPAIPGWDKKTMRARMRKKRKKQDVRVARYKNDIIARSVMFLPQLKEAQTVALYASLPEEVATEDIVIPLLAAGKTVCLPTVAANDMHFYQIRDWERDLKDTGQFGIREPNANTCPLIEPTKIDCFITPGVVFDLFGGRIGFGGGFYDRYLARGRPDAARIALAFDFQTVHAVPMQPHDLSVDCVVTERAVYAPMLSRHDSRSEEETCDLAEKLVKQGMEQGVIVLHGDLGTGKTVFVRGLAKALRCREETASPTFIYCREYHGDRPLYHIDGYRIDAIGEPDAVFWEELLDQEGIIAVEWGEKLGTLVPKDAIHLFGTLDSEGNRIWHIFTALQQQSSIHQNNEMVFPAAKGC